MGPAARTWASVHDLLTSLSGKKWRCVSRVLARTDDPPALTSETPPETPRSLWRCPSMWRRDGDLRTLHRRGGPLPLSPDRPRGPTMTCSFSSRNLTAGAPAREDCPPHAPSYRPASRPCPIASFCPPDASFCAYLILSCHQQHNSKPITPPAPNGLNSSRSIENAPGTSQALSMNFNFWPVSC